MPWLPQLYWTYCSHIVENDISNWYVDYKGVEGAIKHCIKMHSPQINPHNLYKENMNLNGHLEFHEVMA